MLLPNPTDLLIKRSGDDVNVWLSESYLRTCVSVSDTYLRKMRSVYKSNVAPCLRNGSFMPDTNKAWRFARVNGIFYYCYTNIPDVGPTYYKSQLPSKEVLLAARPTVQPVSNDIETFLKPYLNEYYKEFFPAYAACNPVQQINLSKAAAVVKAGVDFIQAHKVNLNKNDFFIKFANLLEELSIPYTRKNFRRLKEQLKEALQVQDVTKVVRLPREGNANAVVHSDDDEIKSWILQMRESGNNYSNAHIIRKVRLACTLTGKAVPSDRWIGEIFERHNTKWLTAAGRYGATGQLGSVYRGYIPLKNAIYAGDCWQIDGTRINLIDFKLNNKNVFLYIVAVRDVHSGDVLGYSFDISENRWTVHNALKMAVEETGCLPWQMVFDRFPGHNTEEMKNLFADLETRGVKINFSFKATGKARLERWFSTLQQVFMQDSAFYYGEGVKSRNPFAHRSKEAIKAIKKKAKEDGWDFDQAVNEACKLIEAYRSTKLSAYSKKYKSIDQSPADLYEASEKPNVVNIEPHAALYLFGQRTVRKFTGDGLLVLTIQGVEFAFRCADPEVVSRFARVTVCYDYEDLSTVHLYEISDRPVKRYLGTATEASVQMYGPQAEWKKKQQQDAILANMQQERERQLAMAKAAGSDVNLHLGGAISKDEYEREESMYLLKDFNSNSDVDDYTEDHRLDY